MAKHYLFDHTNKWNDTTISARICHAAVASNECTQPLSSGRVNKWRSTLVRRRSLAFSDALVKWRQSWVIAKDRIRGLSHLGPGLAQPEPKEMVLNTAESWTRKALTTMLVRTVDHSAALFRSAQRSLLLQLYTTSREPCNQNRTAQG